MQLIHNFLTNRGCLAYCVSLELTRYARYYKTSSGFFRYDKAEVFEIHRGLSAASESFYGYAECKVANFGYNLHVCFLQVLYS